MMTFLHNVKVRQTYPVRVCKLNQSTSMYEPQRVKGIQCSSVGFKWENFKAKLTKG